MSDQPLSMEQLETKVFGEITNLLTKLPRPDKPADDIESNTVRIFNDSEFSTNYHDIDIDDFLGDVRHKMYNNVHNQANWILWNLPLGTVMTMTEHNTPLEKGQAVFDLNNCGRCIDLVGTGKTEAVDLGKMGMADCIKAFFWRKVDLKMGAFELWDYKMQDTKENEMGARQIIFLGEWAPGTVHPLWNWNMTDKVSSARWNSLIDRQTVTLFEHIDGGGNRYENIKGWGKHKEEKDFHNLDFGDKVSSFKWHSINPVKEKVEPIKITPDQSNTSIEQGVESGTNDSDQVQQGKVTIGKTKTREVTVESTDTTASSVAASLKTTTKAGVEGVSTMEVEWSLAVEHSWSHSGTTANKTTTTDAIIIEQGFNISPHRTYTAKLEVRVGRLENKLYKTTATRWYEQNVAGSTKDGKLYKRIEPVYINVTGSLHFTTHLELHETPIPKSIVNQAIDQGQKVGNNIVDKSQEKAGELKGKGQKLFGDLKNGTSVLPG